MVPYSNGIVKVIFWQSIVKKKRPAETHGANTTANFSVFCPCLFIKEFSKRIVSNTTFNWNSFCVCKTAACCGFGAFCICFLLCDNVAVYFSNCRAFKVNPNCINNETLQCGFILESVSAKLQDEMCRCLSPDCRRQPFLHFCCKHTTSNSQHIF